MSVSEAEVHPELYRVEKVPAGQIMSWLNKNQPDEHMTFIFDKKNDLVGVAAMSDQAGHFRSNTVKRYIYYLSDRYCYNSDYSQ